ncbi:TatD family hydrolase [Treponema sp. TIM-1]|uniref:TatD family hydrolase n=1 Tax=Treponema sp. TIM-1 TaxID=2898417 RepID=UPI00397FACB4
MMRYHSKINRVLERFWGRPYEKNRPLPRIRSRVLSDMLTDAHCHPWDLLLRFPEAGEERRRLGIACAASAWNREDFICHEALARQGASPRVVCCFGVHPQLPAAEVEERLRSEGGPPRFSVGESLALLETLAEEGRLEAIGETGFDRYNQTYRATAARQEELFALHLELAVKKRLPLVLHIRRAMDKVFFHARTLKKLPAVVLHSYSGTLREGLALLKRGVEAYFSFGAPILLNHKTAMEACALLPPERLLLETDAPYQPLRGRAFSQWGDLPRILRGAAALRQEAGSPCGTPEEVEALTGDNFFRVYGAG